MGFWPSILGPRQSFEGGLFLPEHKAVTARLPIEDMNVDGPLHVPLQATRDLPTEPLIRVGEKVTRGRRLSRPLNGDSVPVHAPTSGTIRSLERVWTPRDGFVPGAVLEPDGADSSAPRTVPWEHESFLRQLAENGVVGARPRGSVHSRIREAMSAGATVLVINAMETEPYLTAELRMLVEEPGRLMDATCEIADAVGARRVLFALPFRHRRVVHRVEAEAVGRHVEVTPLANKYPQCDPLVLIRTLLQRDVAPGGCDLDAGVLVLPITTVHAIADAVFLDRPLTHVVITIAGDAVERPGTYRVAIGTPVGRLGERVGVVEPVASVVVGGPLTGVAVDRDEAVVTADATAILYLAEVSRPDPVPCIHCGWCVEDCPIGLDPSRLVQLEGRPDCAPAEIQELVACVDCGLCSHVCPAGLPISAAIIRTRGRVAPNGNGSTTQVHVT